MQQGVSAETALQARIAFLLALSPGDGIRRVSGDLSATHDPSINLGRPLSDQWPCESQSLQTRPGFQVR